MDLTFLWCIQAQLKVFLVASIINKIIDLMELGDHAQRRTVNVKKVVSGDSK